MTLRRSTIINSLVLFCLTAVLILPALAVAQDNGSQPGATAEGQPEEGTPIAIKQAMETFEYQIEGRPDPFAPFITERATSNENPDEIIDRDVVLTGMQLFEPGQLTLVALMHTDADKFAMVQDFTGKGYIIKEGTKIGRRGIVSQITDNKVLIQETAQTRGGKVLTNQIAMVLKKEGEE